jgi:hypothetical protein
MTLTEQAAKRAGRSRLARARKSLTPTQLFFFENAGYSYDPKTETPEQGRRRCAVSMAADEEYVTNLINSTGWHYEWTYDQDIDDSWMTDEERAKDHTWECCTLFDGDDNVMASCGGIVDADHNYRRVMEAELAGEALIGYDREIEVLDAH